MTRSSKAIERYEAQKLLNDANKREIDALRPSINFFIKFGTNHITDGELSFWSKINEIDPRELQYVLRSSRW